jgi:hypothetical protein
VKGYTLLITKNYFFLAQSSSKLLVLVGHSSNFIN